MSLLNPTIEETTPKIGISKKDLKTWVKEKLASTIGAVTEEDLLMSLCLYTRFITSPEKLKSIIEELKKEGLVKEGKVPTSYGSDPHFVPGIQWVSPN